MKNPISCKYWYFTILLILFTIILIDCKSEVNTYNKSSNGSILPNTEKPENSSINNMEFESFDKFFERFCFEEEFQFSRIKFPLVYIHLNDDLTDRDTTYIQKKDWNFRSFNYGPNMEARGQLYDSFEHKLRDTDERVFAWHGIGNGIKDFYYFKRINGLWYLIKEEDLST